MATFKSDLVVKQIRHRGLYAGKEQTVSGSIVLNAGGSYALADLLQMVPLGENVRPIRITAHVTPLTGTPVLTNPTFNVGVTTIKATPHVRADGTSYPVITTSASVLSPAVLLADNTKTDIEIPRPVADSVANYAPYYVTMTPAGAGAFSVAGGNIQLTLEVTYLGEIKPNALVYTVWNAQKVQN